MRSALPRILRALLLVATLLLQHAAVPLGAAAPDLLLAAAIGVALRRGERFAAPVAAFAALRACLSIDPPLASVAFVLLAAEGAAAAGSTFFGERALVPAASGFAAAVAWPALRALLPGGVSVPGIGALLLSGVGTGVAASLGAAFVFARRKPGR